MKYVGIDLGGTNIAVGIVDENGTILCQKSTPTLSQNGDEDVIRRIGLAVQELMKENEIRMSEIASVGIGCPGSVDMVTGTIMSAGNLGFKNTRIAEKLSAFLGMPVFVANDADCAILAEASFGAAANTKNAVLITLGTGIGGGIVIDGKLYSGCNSFCGEFGHMIISNEGELCCCGNRGCLETFASATALSRDTKRFAMENPNSLLWECRESDGTFSAKTVFDAAKKGDAIATHIIERYIKYLSIGLVNIINILHPEVIVIGGGISEAGVQLMIPLSDAVMKNACAAHAPGSVKTKIVAAHFRNSAGIIGAAMLGKEKGTVR